MYHAGQKLFVSFRRDCARDMEITKAGRKWLELDGGIFRADIDTLEIDGKGYSSPGRAYASREEFEALQAAQRAWSDFSHRVRFAMTRPEKATPEAIRQASEILGL